MSRLRFPNATWTVMAFAAALVAGLATTTTVWAQYPYCDIPDGATSGICIPGPGGVICDENSDCIVPFGTLFDTCEDGSGDVCNLADTCNATTDRCAQSGVSCLVDDDCHRCTQSYGLCTDDSTCGAGSGLDVCSVSRLLCNSDDDCRTSEALRDGCMNEIYNFYNGNQNLNCTANDISIAETSILTIIDACEYPGDFATVQLEADLLLTATGAGRHDVGVYLASDGGDALFGDCLVEIVPEVDPALFGPGQPADLDSDCTSQGCGEDDAYPCSPTGYNYDQCGFIDMCGDISGVSPFDNWINDVPLSPITLPCVDNNGDGQADLPSCLSWTIPGDNRVCTSPLDVYPATPAKCRCEVIDIPLAVPKSLEVVKVTVPSAPESPTFELWVDPPGNEYWASGGDGTTTGRRDVSSGSCALDADVACVELNDCDGGTYTVAAGDYCDPSDRTVFELGGTADLADYYSKIDCVSRIGSCSLEPNIPCSLDEAVPDPCPTLNAGVCSGTPTTLVGSSCTDCTTVDVPILAEQTDILCTITNYLLEVDLTKTCDAVGKVGDPVSYTITFANDSAVGAPDLECTITDTLLGDVLDAANSYVTSSTCPTDGLFASGDTCTVTLSRTVAEGDDDPLGNTVTADCTYAGGTTIVASDEESCSTDLFKPAVSIVKRGDTLSKVGDDVSYTFDVTNDSTAGTPDLTCSITDTLLGTVVSSFTLAVGGTHTETVSRTVLETDPDPLLNTATVSCTVGGGFGNAVTDTSDEHSVNLIQPSITFVKTGDELSKIGDPTGYTITLTNTSSADTPDLTCTITDVAIGVSETVTLAAGADAYVINKTANIPADASDPYVNTASVSCTVAGLPNVLSDSDDHSVNLFQPSITLDKTGDALSKIGDPTNYTITLDNTSSDDTPDLTCTITDAAIGVDETVTLAFDAANHVISAIANIPADASDPYVNTASVSCSVAGFPNTLTASDDHSVNLFQPAITFAKTGDALSKIGDPTDYTITLRNTSSSDTPELSCTVTDTPIGVNATVTLAAGADPYVINKTANIPAGASDPYVNTASVSCSVAGFPNTLTASDDHSVNLFQPSITFDKTGDALSKIGDDVNYTITLDNTSSADTPSLSCTVSDVMLGISKLVTLASGASDTTTATYTVPGGAPDPLVNTANVTCSPEGFPNELTASDGHSVDLFQPSITFDKTGDALSKIGDPTDYTITLTNTSSSTTPDLTCTITDAALGVNETVTVAAGGRHTIQTSAPIPGGASDPYVNTASVSCAVAGFSNVLTASDDHSVNLFQPAITFAKTGDALSKIGDPTDYTITLTNTSSSDTPELSCTVTDTPIGVNATVTLAAGADPYVINKTANIPAGASDPYVNTASVSCAVAGFSNVLTASDGHSVNLFQPSISFEKSGDLSGKIGDVVAYTMTLNNTSSADTPSLSCTVSDAMLGISKPVTLASGASDTTNAAYTVPGTAQDPLVNTAEVTCSPAGFPNVLSASDDHSVQLFQASIELVKTGDAVSKVGDDVNYTITLKNTSSSDTPDLVCTITDPTIGFSKDVTLASGASDTTAATYTVPGTAQDPLVNTASVTCSPAGFENVLSDEASWTTNLFLASINIVKTGDQYSKNWGGQADQITYNVTITNTSSDDTPNLSLVSYGDTLVAGVVAPAECDDLGYNESCSFSYTYTPTVTQGQGNSLVNTFSAVYNPDGFPNQVTDNDGSNTWTVTMIHPSFTVSKTCTTEPVPQAGPATWDVVIANTGDVELVVTADDGIGTFDLAAGASQTFPVSALGPFADPTVSNTVNASWVLPAAYGLSNTASASASDFCYVAGDATVIKLTQGVPNDSGNTWRFTIQDCGTDGCTSDVDVDPIIGDVTSPPSEVNFDLDLVPYQLNANQTYRLCEVLIPVGWSNMWMGDANDDGAVETAIPFVPAVGDDPVLVPPGWSRVFDPLYLPPPALWDNSERCINFVADAGATEVFQIDNQFPGGEPRTIGYWKNWNSCTGGGQVLTAIANGGETPQERLLNGYALLDDVLQPPGITIGTLNMQADDDVFRCDAGTQNAVYILDKRDIVTGKKKASDPAFNLASQLLAAIANDSAGAYVCPVAGQAIIDATNLLSINNFNGTGSYFKKNPAGAALANSLASTLDAYNNGTLCAMTP